MANKNKMIYVWTIICMACLVSATTLSAQLRFSWPDTAVDLSRYNSVEQCLAATARIRDGVVRSAYLDVNMDTMPKWRKERVNYNPPVVVDIALKCSEKFNVEEFAFDDGWTFLMNLLWQADRVKDMRSLEARRLASIDKSDSIQMAIVLDSIIAFYQSVYPRQLYTADSLLVLRNVFPPAEKVDARRIAGNINQLGAAIVPGEDTSLARRAAERIVALADNLSDEDRKNIAFIQARPLIYFALNYLTEEEALDSLNKGSEPFVALRQANWRKANGGRQAGATLAVGKRAANLVGDFRFSAERKGAAIFAAPSTDNLLTRPRNNRISLIVFWGRSCGVGAALPYVGSLEQKSLSAICMRSMAAVRRLSDRFPELDVTIVTQTYGYFSYLMPVNPDEEAEWIRKWFHGHERIPGTLIVEKTSFWNLPGPDNRRINEAWENHDNYSFGNPRKGNSWVPTTTAFLVDRNGIILHQAKLDAGLGYAERDIGKLLSIMVSESPSDDLYTR